MFLIEPIRNFYSRFERPISSLSLLLGFAFDALTLKSVGAFWENFWIIGHLAIVGIFIALIHIVESEEGDEKNPNKMHFWFVNVLQFFFGGLLSTFIVFYFRSADIFITWPFITILVIAFIANESLKRHYVRLSFQISLFFLSIYSFAIFLVPVLMHRIGTEVFLLSGAVSLIFIALFVSILLRFAKNKFIESKKIIFSLVLGIFAVVNFLYFSNLIPPIPLSLKDAGVYHSIEKDSNGDFLVGSENYSWKDFFQFYQNFEEVPGSPVYAYSAIFSPPGLNITIIHEWQHYDETQKKWITESEINLPVIGGREGGFRTYSLESNPTPGKWRVNVLTLNRKLIGHLQFNIISTNTAPILTSEVK